MKKVLLALTTVALAASALPAQAVTTVITRTITAPTYLQTTGSPFSLPSILANPTNPDGWQKIGVVGRNARCGYLKQTDGTVPAGTFQDGVGGKLGYVIALPSAFGNMDSFSLKSHVSNPTTFDFDVLFYSSLGKCVSDVEVELPADQGTVTVPVEGSGPKPDADDPQCVQDKQAWTTLFNDSGTVGSTLAGCAFDANFAVVVMPIGANGKFDLTLTY